MLDAAKSSGDPAGAVILILVLIVVGIALYFLPTFIAHRRHHHQFTSILVLNIFLGWTFIGWVVCLAMSLSSRRTLEVRQWPTSLPWLLPSPPPPQGGIRTRPRVIRARRGGGMDGSGLSTRRADRESQAATSLAGRSGTVNPRARYRGPIRYGHGVRDSDLQPCAQRTASALAHHSRHARASPVHAFSRLIAIAGLWTKGSRADNAKSGRHLGNRLVTGPRQLGPTSVSARAGKLKTI